MKKNSKKRALISSVAMLMVATVSLGSATYAWFTQDTTARTENLGVKTAKTSTLQISDDELDTKTGELKNWGSVVDYKAADQVLIPTSTDDGDTWFSAYAEKGEVFTSLKGTMDELDSTAGYAFVNQLNVRNAGKADVENVKINFNLPTDKNYDYVRVALVPAVAGGPNAALATGADFTKCVYANNLTKYAAVASVTGTGENQTFTTTDITPAKNGVISITVGDGNLPAVSVDEDGNETYTEKYYNLYVWFEGQDEDCKTTNAGVEIPNIQFTVTGDVVDDSAQG